jgi:hypothetical protein
VKKLFALALLALALAAIPARSQNDPFVGLETFTDRGVVVGVALDGDGNRYIVIDQENIDRLIQLLQKCPSV